MGRIVREVVGESNRKRLLENRKRSCWRIVERLLGLCKIFMGEYNVLK